MDIRIGIEVPVFLFFFSTLLCNPVNINFIIYRTCYVTLGFNKVDCTKLGTGSNESFIKHLEKQVQPEANVILITSVVLNQIIPPILCLFIGPWSDKHGRRPVLLATLLGHACLYLSKTIISVFPWISPWYLLLECIPIILSGGFSSFLMISICYVTDITSDNDRGMRMGIFEVCISMGILVGTLTSSYLFNSTNYTTVFVTSALSVSAALLYSIVCIKESVENTNDNDQDDSSVLSFVHIKDMFKTTFKPRATHSRPILLLLITSLTLYILAINNGNAKFLFLRYKFNWSVERYTVYSSMHSLLWVMGTLIGVYILHKLLLVQEGILLIIGYASMALSTLVQGVANTDWEIYLAAGIQAMGAVITPMSRSLISKVVHVKEVGKVFALTVAMEAFAAILSNTFNSLIYNSTMNVYPGAFNFYGTIIYSFTMGLTMIILILRNKQRHGDVYEDLGESD